MVTGRGDSEPTPASTRSRLLSSALELAALRGVDAVSVRSIAKKAGVTEGALYKHFSSKENLWTAAYTTIMRQMVEEKRQLLAQRLSARQTIQEWVRLTYAFYDGNRDAFTYVLLIPHPLNAQPSEFDGQQSKLFAKALERGRAAGEVRELPARLAASIFSGLLLSVPTWINEGGLRGPALRYAPEVAECAWRVFRADARDGQ